jgi:GGDEF domain-containing protein
MPENPGKPSSHRANTEHMLPNPHIRSFNGDAYRLLDMDISAINQDMKALFEGRDPVTISGRGMIRLAQEARENTTDARSGLLNPKGLEMWFDRYQPDKYMILMCDARNFGDINKRFGHNTGNEVIGFIGRQVSHKIRSHDDQGIQHGRATNRRDVAGSASFLPNASSSVSARWGGDEFITIIDLSDVDDEDISRVQRDIEQRFNNFGTYENDDKSIEIPISIRSASIVGKKQDKKTFNELQVTVDEKLKEVVKLEKLNTTE